MRKATLDASTWAQLEQLLDAALDQPASERGRWIDRLGAEHAALQPRLRALLSHAADGEASSYLDTLPTFDAAWLDLPDAASDGDQSGDEVGPFRLLRELGSGGMAVVWLAERADGLITRPVALKLPHGAWVRPGLAERMARERRILATLSHPHIAHLYDAGVTAGGRPYLAIEYVEGDRIDVYCRQRRLDVEARLRLFAQAAGAVAFAHGKLVLHRDLKPANILVNAGGQVRLLDFGIATLLDDGTAKETGFTELSGRALTPGYASPEQTAGEPLTVASDVYSLGVVLYELLAGQRPYTQPRDSRSSLDQAIPRSDPPLPSTVAEPARRGALRGDLDTVVLKALKTNTTERYPTVHALLDDIERYLGSRPVLAQRDSRWYRARKFVARNTLAVSAAAAVAVALIGGALVAGWQARVALAEKARAEEVQTFIASVFREADPMLQREGKALSAVDLLLQAERRLNERTEANPQLTVEMLAIIGESLFGLQDSQQSARVLEGALRLQQSTPDAEPLLSARLHLALSQAREMLGDTDAAVAELARAFAALGSAQRDAGSLAVRARLHESALGMATGDYTITERAARAAIDEATAAIGPGADEVAMGLMFLSKAYIFTKRMPQAVAPARQGLDILLANHHGDYAHSKLIDLAPYYANALIHVGDFEAAAHLLRELVANAERVFGADSRVVGELTMVAMPAELERGELDEAVSLARRSLNNHLKEARPETPLHAYRARLLGQALAVARAGDEAVRTLEEAVRLSVQAGAPRAGRSFLGIALVHAGRLDEADEQLRLALEGAAPGSRAEMQTTRHRGTLLRFEGKAAEAIPWLERSVAASATSRFDRGEHAMALVELGLTRLALGEVATARRSFVLAEAILDELQPQRMTPTRADLLIGMARIQLGDSGPAEALPALQATDAYWRAKRPDSRWAGEAALWLARAHQALGQGGEGRAALARASGLLSSSNIPADMALLRRVP